MNAGLQIRPISLPNPMSDHLIESSHRDDSNKWSNIGFGEEITQVESIEVNFTDIIWYPVYVCKDPATSFCILQNKQDAKWH